MPKSCQNVISLETYRRARAKKLPRPMWSFIVGIQPVIFWTPVWVTFPVLTLGLTNKTREHS
jgi:hypothetical protein